MGAGHQWVSRALIRVTALAVAVPLAIVVAAAPAHADDDGTTKLKQLITDATNWTKAGLDKVGPLAQPLPLLATSPGSLVEAEKLLELANPHLQSALNQDIDLGGGSRLYSTLTGPSDNYLLDVRLVVKKELIKQNLTAAGVTATEAVKVTGWATVRVKARYTPADGAYLIADSEAPRIDVDARAQFRPDLAAAKASIGILAVALTAGTLDARTHMVATVTDPNHDGKLAFGTGGELSAAGSLAGLVQVGLDGSGGGKISDTENEPGPGSFHADVSLGAALEGAPAGLPASIAANIKVDWNDISTGTPVVSTTGLDGVLNKFRNMSPLDLAAGLAQLATLIEAMQRSGGAGNLSLPFLRGTFADAVKINEKIVAFLDEFVYPKPGDPDFGPGDDPARAGQPKFSSIQELLKLLNDKGLLASTPMTYADDKLSFKLTYAKASTVEVPLDPGAAKVSGSSATFLPNGFQLDDNRFQPGTLKGQRVVAGISAGTVKDNTANAIELEEAQWIGGQPADDSTWIISSSDPHIGAVELGGLLAGTTTDGKKIGAKAANASVSLAKVKPSYEASVTVVLNLADNIATPTDRVMLRTVAGEALFKADFPITTVSEFYTSMGFLRVKLSGDLALGPATAGARMLQVKWDSSQDITLGTLFQQLKDTPAALVDVSTSVKATGQFAVSLPGDTGPLGEGIAVRLSWVAGSTPFVDISQLTALFALDFDPDDPAALFALVVKSLQLVNSALADSGSGGLLDQKIPLVNKTGRELIGSDESGVGKDISYTADGANFQLKDVSRSGNSEFKARLKDRTIIIGTKAYRVLDKVDGQTLRIAGGTGVTVPEAGAAYALRPELVDALDRLLANPPETLQDVLDIVNKVIGEGFTFTFDQREGGPYIRLGMDWQRSFHTGRPINFNWSGVGDLVSLDASGAVYLDITGSAHFGLLIPLKLNGAPKLDHESSASVEIKAGADNVALAARVGPLGIDVGKADNPGKVQANMKFALASPDEEDKSLLDGLLGLTPQLTTDGTDCGGDPLIGGPTKFLCARAPVFINDCDPGTSDNTLSFQADMDFNVTTGLPSLGTCLENLILKFTDFNVGIDGYLAKLEEALRLASFDGKLPLVGDDLQQGQRFIHDLREDIKAKIGTALANTPADSLSDALAAKLTEELQKIDPGMTVVITCQGASPCGLPSVQSVRLKMVKQQGNPNAATGCVDVSEDNKCLGFNTPLDLGIPGLSLKARKGATGGVSGGLGWKLQLEFGLDRTEGFFIATGADSAELQIGAFFDAGDLEAQLAFIQVDAKKKPDHASIPLVRAYFAIDLRGAPGDTPCFESCTALPDSKLTLAEFSNITEHVATRVSANVDIFWELKASISTNPDNESGSVLPGIVVDFKLKWDIGNHTGKLVAGNLDIGFSNFQLDVGDFFTKILKPVLDKVKKVTEPLQPIIDTLYAPIPVLSDLSHAVGGPDITLIWLAETFSTLAGGPSLKFVHTIRNVITFINNMPKCEASCRIPIGSFKVLADKALDTLASPSSADSLIDPSNQTVENVKGGIDSKTTGTKLFSSPTDDETGAQKIGFSFPVFDNPKSLFGLLMGQDVELVAFDSGPLELGFSWRQSFGPVYAPPPVFITLSGSASVTARFMAGLDTKGIRHAYEAITGDVDLSAIGLLDGLYFKTHDNAGNAIPVVQLRGEIAAGAEVSIFIIKVGLEGGISLTVGFHWNDPNNDGKFRLSEFIQRLKVSPICLFTTSGELRVFLRLYFEINLFLFKKKWTFTIVNAVLLDFKAQPDCDPPPPELGGVINDANDDTLVVYAGKFGTGSVRNHSVWDNGGKGDVVKIYALHFIDMIENKPGETPSDDFDGFVVEALGRKQEFRTSEFPNLKRVVVDGRGYSVPPDKTAMSIVFLSDGHPSGQTPGKKYSFEKDAIVIGSEGNDNVRLGTGLSLVDGRDGADTIVVGNEDPNVKVRVAGGGGDDNITTGNGNATIAGDSSLNPTSLGSVNMHNSPGPDTLSGVVNWNALADPTDDPENGSGIDTLTVGFGANSVYGNGGADVLATMVKETQANGPNIMVGGNGDDTINGGNGNDKIYTYSQVTSDVDAYGHGPTGQTDSVDTGKGEDDVHGSAGVDLVVSHSANGQTGEIFGYGGNDVLIGGYGTDRLFGGPDQDYVLAETSDVEDAGADDGYGPFRKVTHQPLPSGVQSQTKLLVGGLGKDHIIGGDGGAVIFGDKYLTDETCADNSNHVQVNPADQGAADLILGGAGVEIVSAGSGDDRSDLGGGADRACGQLGNDVLALGGGNDKAWGGDGVDQITGDDGEDTVYGNSGNDGLYGGPGKDILEGNADSDSVYGDGEDDNIFGGTRLAGQLDGVDYLYGDAGNDNIVGDNGSHVVSASSSAYPLDLDGLNATFGAGDIISGGPGNDHAYGGLGPDNIHGDAHDDHLEGNNDTDIVHGDFGFDVIIGGSSQQSWPDKGDFLYGDTDADLIAGDNARFDEGTPTRITQGRGSPARAITMFDLGLTPDPAKFGADYISGGESHDLLLGQNGTDRLTGGEGDDYAEGGSGEDWIEGNMGQDDLVGGSYLDPSQADGADMLFGGPQADVILGDNGSVLSLLAGDQPTSVTVRIGMTPRKVLLLDTAAVDSFKFGADRINGGDGVDVVWGQDGDDGLHGDGDGDYMEGNGGADDIRGDAPLTNPLPDPGWPGAASVETPSTTDGQDDLIGGSSAQAFRDTDDVINGDGHDDVILGDNGSLLRTIVNGAEKVYTERYPTGADLTQATVVRSHDPALPGPSTRFCTTALSTCEPLVAFGDDQLRGGGGNDGIWGQDGDDLIYGGDGDDDLLGELGADVIFGEGGNDAILGDRGGVMNEYLNADDVTRLGFTQTLSSVPQETYTAFRLGTYDRRVDLFHDTDGDVWVGASTSMPMPHDSFVSGADDRIRGGSGRDNIHGGYGEDLMNGDSGGDEVFGGDGSDVLWGGKGCDPVLDAANPQCLVNGVFNPDARGDQDQYVDHLWGGAGATQGPSVIGILSSDLHDFKPRGSYPGNCTASQFPESIGATAIDPCTWFEMTEMTNASEADNQHHQGTDWMYGGWDRDVFQGDVAANGPSNGDRLFDWNGAYNLYTHCNAAYGGYNDIRQHSPALQQFLTRLAWGTGSGRSVTDVATSGTSAYLELAYVYPRDNQEQAVGAAYPGTPGHFDDPTSCTD